GSVAFAAAEFLTGGPMVSGGEMRDPMWYVYGIVAATVPATTMPRGIDDASVAIESHNGIAALVSRLDGGRYAPDVVATASGDVDWLSPRAIAHDRVLTWASDRGAVIPLPMFSLFSSREAVRAMLDSRASQLAATLARVGADGAREYALRVYRVDAELMDSVTSLSPRLAAMATSSAAASPGQRYLLERKLDAEKKTEIRVVSHRLIDEFVAALGAFAREAARSPIPKASAVDAARGTLVLNAAFLVDSSQLDEFQRTLTTLVERHGTGGFRFDFTGPWPPYHFVGEAPRGA
ncbi:MAG TPA: GvpL/GvpF family gas vesicle protein, partial [Gemmatimonadaceae bacterium]|nr:GvpL/GvpF family gas vesicle protein [Gemmatimonadaceae bacterium]